MNKIDYLNNLLELCTDKQSDFFDRMYPNGPTSKQINHAIYQIENTLKNLNTSNEMLNDEKKAHAKDVDELTAKISVCNSKLYQLELELKAKYEQLERMENPINIENNKIQERLLLLDALQAGGVDNWQFYDASIEEFNRNE